MVVEKVSVWKFGTTAIFATRKLPRCGKADLNPEADFQLTHEWFGNGRAARRDILVSQRVVRLILEKRWHGIYFVPIQAV